MHASPLSFTVMHDSPALPRGQMPCALTTPPALPQPRSSSSFSSSTALKLRVLRQLYFPDSVSSFLHSLPHPAEMGRSMASSTVANILSVLIPLSLAQALLAKLNSRKRITSSEFTLGAAGENHKVIYSGVSVKTRSLILPRPTSKQATAKNPGSSELPCFVTSPICTMAISSLLHNT